MRRQLWWSALSLLLFWPAALIALAFALVARRRVAVGDLAGAGQATRVSRIACWVSLAVSVVVVIVLLIQGQTKF
ncbi:MAG: CD225/dispanin family protein [Acidimicrobiales bacterium]